MTRGHGMRPGRAGHGGAGLSHHVLSHTMPDHTMAGHPMTGPSPDHSRAADGGEGRRDRRGLN